jgi:hypothetical protein
VPPRKSALVHIGIAKTGTTSIHAALHALARAGRLPAIALPRPGRLDQSFLVAAYKPAEKLPRSMRHAFRGPPDEVRRALRAAWIDALRAGTSIVVLCEFLMFLSDDEVRAFRRDLADAGYDDVRCLAYVRDPAAFYLSAMQQYLKASAAILQPAGFRPGYRQLVGRWRSLFDERMVVRLFKPDRLRDGDVVADFMAVLSKLAGVELPRVPHRRENRTMSVEGMILMQNYRRYLHPGADDRFMTDSTQLAELIPQVEFGVMRPLTTPRLRPAIRDMIYVEAADDVAFLAEEFGEAAPTGTASPAGPSRPFTDVASILEPHDPAALDELQARLVAALLKVAPAPRR